MASPTPKSEDPAPAPANSPQPPSVVRDLLSTTFRLATSWVGALSAYVAALYVLIAKSHDISKGLQDLHIQSWLAIALIPALPLLALVSSTLPAILEHRRIKRYAEITGDLQTGYFTLRPREDERTFERADNAHQEILRWLESTTDPVLYLTGTSGTGKSSILSAWVIPKLQRNRHTVISLRGYENDPLLASKTSSWSQA